MNYEQKLALQNLYNNLYPSCFTYALTLTQHPQAAEKLVQNAFVNYVYHGGNSKNPLDIYLYLAKQASATVLKEGVNPSATTQRSGYPALFGLDNSHMSFSYESSNEPYLIKDIIEQLDEKVMNANLPPDEHEKCLLACKWFNDYGTDTKLSVILLYHLEYIAKTISTMTESYDTIAKTISRPMTTVQMLLENHKEKFYPLLKEHNYDIWSLWTVIANYLSITTIENQLSNLEDK